MEIRKYKKEYKDIWNSFIDNSKNSSFLFKRDFMEYHKDRFEDFSLMAFNGEKLIGILPANRTNEEVISHSGLTYGGLVVEKKIRLNEYLKILREILLFFHNNKITFLKVKAMPVFYSSLPSQENIYAMFIVNAKRFRVDTSLTIVQNERLSYQSRRKRSIKKANTPEYSILRGNNFKEFWEEILEPNLLERFGTKPVHSLFEIEQLSNKFPNNISQVSIYKNNKIVAGSTIFETEDVAHAQYISANDFGRKNGALDKLFDYMIMEVFNDKKYFDFGISNEEEGRFLNHGLLDWKEGFGARTFVHEFYAIETANFYLLDKIIKND